MLAKRIIPCLDVKNGRVVKGINFVNLTDAGDPVECAAAYDKAGADELTFLDITASSDARRIMLDTVRAVAKAVYIPFTVGGGIRSIEDYSDLLHAGAEKVSVNSFAVAHRNCSQRPRRNSAPSAWSWPLMQSGTVRFSRSIPMADARPRGWTPCNGRKRSCNWGQANCC